MASGGYTSPVPAQLVDVSEKNNPLQLHVKTLAGVFFDLTVDASDTLESVKDKIQELHGISPDHQNLLLGRKELAGSSSTLAKLNVPDKATLTLLNLAPGVYEDSQAPFLRKFFLKVVALRPWDLLAESSGSDLEATFKSKSTEAIEDEKNLITKSFEGHDKNGDGVLDRDEAEVFFLHIIEELSYSFKAALPAHLGLEVLQLKMKLLLLDAPACQELTSADVERIVAPALEEIRVKLPKLTDEEMLQFKLKHIRIGRLISKSKELSTLSAEDHAEKRSKWEGRLLEQAAEYQVEQENFEELRKAYIAQKEERDTAAFALLDVNNDGTVSLSSVLDALMPSAENSEKFYIALGFDF